MMRLATWVAAPMVQPGGLRLLPRACQHATPLLSTVRTTHSARSQAVLAGILVVLLIIDFMFLDDSSFLFDPDIKVSVAGLRGEGARLLTPEVTLK